MKIINFRNDILPLKDKLYRLALRITLNHAEAEDVVQETMMKVWNKRDTWAAIDSIEAFCLTTCRNIALDKLKRADNNNQTLDTAHGNEPADSSYTSNPQALIMQQDRMMLVKAIIDRLPEKQRTAMQLRDFEGKTYREIALIMGVSEDQVKINIFRARQTIKKEFIEKENYGL